MQTLFRQNTRWVRPLMAGLMAGMVLLLSVFAASEKLHLALHQESATSSHTPCAVCSVSQGLVEVPVTLASAVSASLSVSWTLPSLEAALPRPIDFSVATSRGPPASVSSLL